MTLTVKRWIADREQAKATRYDLFIDVEYVDGYYADTENDTVTFADVEILSESEKAIQISAGCGSVVGKGGTWKTWIPKSQVVM